MGHKGFLFLLAFCIAIPTSQTAAQSRDLRNAMRDMAELIGEQQKQLEEQRRELERQREMIRQLQEAQGIVPTDAQPAAAVAAEPVTEAPPAAEPVTEAPPAAVAEPEAEMAQQAGEASGSTTDDGQSAQEQAREALAKQQAEGPKSTAEQIADLQKVIDDPSNTIYDENFPGAWYLPGTTAAMRIGGYVNLSVVNSFDPLLIQDRFIVGSIPAEGDSVPGAVAGTSVSADQTRLNLEYREQTNLGEIRAFIEGDFRGDDGTGDGENFRLRHAFGQFRAILAGKTWSTFMDVDSRPEEVDVEGMNAQILLRHSQIRWTPQFGEKFKLKLSLEDPTTDVINGASERSRGDLVASLVSMPLGPIGRWNYRVAFILRDLKATGTQTTPGADSLTITDGTIGWGITTSGRQPVKWWGDGRNNFVWQLTYGEGIGHYINDLGTIGGGDAIFDPTGKLKALPVFAGYLSYQHIWPKRFRFMKNWPGILRSNLNLGVVDIKNYEFQSDRDYNRTIRASVNMIYNPTTNVQLGLEFLWGRRTNKDESKGSASQIQFAARYSF